MKEKGIGGNLGKWVHSYLSQRTQTVIANNHMSKEVQVLSGVPQGSVIGPILFLLLIDDISDIKMSSSLGIFADDTRVTKVINDLKDTESLQDDLNDLYDWAISNNMEFNGLKFQALNYGRNEF